MLNIIIRWKRGEYSWWVRAIRSDGSYWGEYREPTHSGLIEGKISLADYERIVALTESIKSKWTEPQFAEDHEWLGLIAEGKTTGDGILLFRCYKHRPMRQLDSAFEEIVNILETYVTLPNARSKLLGQ